MKMTPFRALLKRYIFQPNYIISSRIITSSKSFTNTTQISNTNAYSILSDHLKNHRLNEARAFYDQIQFPDVYLSTKMITSYLENSMLNDALNLFDHLPVRDVVMWNLMIKGCVNSGKLDMGLALFEEMPERNVVSWTTVMNAFLKCGKIDEAQVLFEEMPVRDIAAWNAIIHGCFENGKVEEARRLFEVMSDRNVISWTTMISGLDRNGRIEEGLCVFEEMVRIGVKPSPNTYSCAMKACASVGDLLLGKQIHTRILKLGYVFDPYITATLVTFYANCKLMEDSVKSFNENLHMNVVVWTSLLTGYGNNGAYEDAVRVFGGMIRFGVIPNQSSFTSALNSSCEMEAIDVGKGIHGLSIKLGLETDLFVGNSLVVLYSKCGNINEGILAFKGLDNKNIVSWNAIIVGFAKHGFGEWALAFFTQMVKKGIDPDEITFTALLSSCSHSGMLQKGRHFFESLSQYPFLRVNMEHYACMVDILCRSGRLEEAEDLVKNMPFEANLSIWIALLSGCSQQCNLEVAERVSKRIFAADPHNCVAHVLLSNMYALAGRWNDVATVREEMCKIGTVKEPGQSWIS